ncbi:hypothetical protein GQ600_27150 [Phytophthora cactorum]|nr:hypothetical protein GQ600_27150 [Phytophthora cactorum]
MSQTSNDWMYYLSEEYEKSIFLVLRIGGGLGLEPQAGKELVQRRLHLVVVGHRLHALEPGRELGVLGKVVDAHELHLHELAVGGDICDRGLVRLGHKVLDQELLHEIGQLG